MDGLEAEWGEQVLVIRLNIHEEDAQPILDKLDFRFSPTFVLFNGSGAEVWRDQGSLDPDRVKQAVADLKAGR